MSKSVTKQIPSLEECKKRFASFGECVTHSPSSLLYLPSYTKGSKKYNTMKHAGARDSKKYGIVTTKIPLWELDLERGTKYCKTCNNIKDIRFFAWSDCVHGFNTQCRKCRNLRFSKNNKKNIIKAQLLVSPQGIKCNWCNRSDCKLEFNHIHGDGTKQVKLFPASNISTNILSGKIDPKILELLCIDCHFSHSAQLKKGISPKDIYEKHQIMLQIPNLDQQEMMSVD